MDINQIKFGGYSSVDNSKAGAKKHNEAKADITAAANNENVKQFDADKVLNALDAAGMQNKVHINFAKKEVNPADYLSSERIAEIEAMMGKFDDGVAKTANVVDAEFPGLSEDMKLALAAQVFAKE